MVKNISHGSSRLGDTKFKLSTTKLLSAMVGGVVLIHVILFWKVSISNTTITNDGSASFVDGGLPQMKIKTGKNGVPVIPFVVSMTTCGEDPFMEGAAVLKYSIHQNSIYGSGKYDYKMYAIYHPDAESCAKHLEDLGYELVERETPVKVEEIQGDFLRSRIEKNGCCGSKELVKLEALTFTDYPVVVHLDLDVVLLKPFDALFDVMLDETGDISKYRQILGSTLMWPNRTLPERVDAFFTRDFGMVKYQRKIKPVQGGFLVLRPSMQVYEDLVNIVKKGDFAEKTGWWAEGKGQTGLFYGSMTIQGLFPFYYDVLQKGNAVDLNRCIYNQMGDAPRAENRKDPSKPGLCFSSEEDCEDCRLRKVEDIVSAHFTICLKPWHCMAHQQDDIEHWQCQKMHKEWFRVRSEMEQNWGREAIGPGNWNKEMFYGFCKRHGKKGYQPVSRPFLPTFN